MIRTMRMHYRFSRLQSISERTGRPITALDLKTTAPDTTTAGILQVGLVTVKPGVPTRGLIGTVNPQTRVAPDTLSAYGLTDEQIDAASPFSEWGAVLAKIALHTVTGFNLAVYNIPLIHAQCARYGIDAPAFESLCDLHDVFGTHERDRHNDRATLGKHAQHYGVKHEHTDALDDALTTLLIAEAVVTQQGDAALGLLPTIAADQGIEHELSPHH